MNQVKRNRCMKLIKVKKVRYTVHLATGEEGHVFAG